MADGTGALVRTLTGKFISSYVPRVPRFGGGFFIVSSEWNFVAWYHVRRIQITQITEETAMIQGFRKLRRSEQVSIVIALVTLGVVMVGAGIGITAWVVQEAARSIRRPTSE